MCADQAAKRGLLIAAGHLFKAKTLTLTFHETSQTITGSSGCNSYQATYQQHNSQAFGRTDEGCLGPVGEQEYLSMQALEQTETLVVSAHTMTLTGVGGKDILRFCYLSHTQTCARHA